jgi:tRNA U54 and U55 pseudouridine synthase Pus10
VRPHPKASLERVELFSFREICQAASLSKFRKMKKAQTAQRTAALDVFFIELRRMASAARQSVSLSKFRKMKKAQTAQRTAALDVFLDRAVSDGERSETIRELEQISLNEKSPDRAADCSFGCVFLG